MPAGMYIKEVNMEFEIGQVFEGIYPPEAASWCNQAGNCYIEEIESINGVRRFEIKGVPAPDEEELKQREIESIKAQLDEIDLKSIRAMRAGETEYIELYESEAMELRTRLEELE